jgi:hypothetical protein
MRIKMGLVVGLLVPLAGILMYENGSVAIPLDVTRVARPSYVVTSERGQIRGGVFERRSEEIVDLGNWALHPDTIQRKCGEPEPVYEKVRRIFQLRSVQAVTCQEGQCNNPYYSPTLGMCPAHCGSFYVRFTWDPTSGNPAGYKISASGDCAADDGSGYCRCQQVTCT